MGVTFELKHKSKLITGICVLISCKRVSCLHFDASRGVIYCSAVERYWKSIEVKNQRHDSRIVSTDVWADPYFLHYYLTDNLTEFF